MRGAGVEGIEDEEIFWIINQQKAFRLGPCLR